MIRGETAIEDELNGEYEFIQEYIKKERKVFETHHHIICGDFNNIINDLKQYKIRLIFTSPPYNAGIDYGVYYSDRKSIGEYIEFLRKFIESSDAILMDGGRLVVNIRDIKYASGSRYPPIVLLFDELCNKREYKYRGCHIWYKGREESSMAWGSWRSCVNPSIIDLYEYIYVFQKGDFEKRKGYTMEKEEFIESDIGVWKIRPVKKICGKEKNNYAGHPCPFPVELPERIIKLYSYEGDWILDPFGGIGSTSVAAALSGRNSISVDVNPDYCSRAEDNIRKCAGASVSTALYL